MAKKKANSTRKPIVYPLRGRYGKISCTLIPVSPNRWRFRSEGGFIRFNESKDDPQKISSIDPEGGPMFNVGDVLHDFFPLLPYERIVSFEIIKEEGLFINTTNTEEQKNEQ